MINKFSVGLFFLFALLSNQLSAQYQIGLIPRESPDRSTYLKMGFTEITINYGSPAVKGRTIWGELEPYERVWRAGANNATTIEISKDITIQDKKLAAGKYSFFVIPNENGSWIIIFNKQHKQWGAFKYDSSQDALRVNIQVEDSEQFNENLEYSIHQLSQNKGEIAMQWEHISLSIPFEIDFLDDFIAIVEAKKESADSTIQWVTNIQGAEYLVNQEQALGLARDWIMESYELESYAEDWNQQFYPKEYIQDHRSWTLAKLEALEGNFHQAIKLAEEIGDRLFYIRESEEEQISKKLMIWKKNLEERLTVFQSLEVKRGDRQFHVKYIDGAGAPYLFVSGAGDDMSIWYDFAYKVQKATGSPVIIYDRCGFGQSNLPTGKNLEEYGILMEYNDVRASIKKLAYDKVKIVAHSYGSYLTYLYATQHPQDVLKIYTIDAVHKYHGGGWAEYIVADMQDEINKWKKEEPGMYYLMKSLAKAAETIDSLTIPSHIPVVNITPLRINASSEEGGNRWIKAQESFLNMHSNSESKEVENTGHYIFVDQPNKLLEIIKNDIKG